MTDRLADRIAEKFQEAAPKLANAFHADSYALYQATRVRNEYGEWVDTWAPAGESGYCALTMYSPNWGGERVVSGIMVTESTYAVEILPPTGITTAHRIQVNDRMFDIKNVISGGEMDMFVMAAIELPGAE